MRCHIQTKSWARVSGNRSIACGGASRGSSSSLYDAIPDRVGNNRLDGMRNILHNPHVGLIFLIPGREDTLRVNGRAWIVEDDAILDAMIVQGKRPPFAIGVEVEEVFMHCPRAFMRAGLWKPERWPDVAAVPSMAAMLWDQLPTRPSFPSAAAYEADQRQRLQTLY